MTIHSLIIIIFISNLGGNDCVHIEISFVTALSCEYDINNCVLCVAGRILAVGLSLDGQLIRCFQSDFVDWI